MQTILWFKPGRQGWTVTKYVFELAQQSDNWSCAILSCTDKINKFWVHSSNLSTSGEISTGTIDIREYHLKKNVFFWALPERGGREHLKITLYFCQRKVCWMIKYYTCHYQTIPCHTMQYIHSKKVIFSAHWLIPTFWKILPLSILIGYRPRDLWVWHLRYVIRVIRTHNKMIKTKAKIKIPVFFVEKSRPSRAQWRRGTS